MRWWGRFGSGRPDGGGASLGSSSPPAMAVAAEKGSGRAERGRGAGSAVVGLVWLGEAGWRRHKLGGELVAGNGGGRENGRGGAETEREARIRLGFGKGVRAARFDARGRPTGGSPYSLYAGEPRGAARFVPCAARGSQVPPVSG